jgi:hypothetical protein
VKTAIEQEKARLANCLPGATPILIGVGDNLAPEYPARKNVSRQAELNEVKADSVVGFLRLMGYQALVPGKEDFYFGTNRLWLIGQALATAPEPVRMMADNLVVRTSPRTPQTKISQKNYRTSYPGVKERSSGTIFTWSKLLHFEFDCSSTADRELLACDAAGVAHPVARFCAEMGNPDTFGSDAATCNPPTQRTVSGDGKKRLYDYEIALPNNPNMHQDESYGFCIGNDPKTRYCMPLKLERSFFLGAPWYVDPQGRVAVFGIVDPNLDAQIAFDDRVWQNPDDPSISTIKTVDAEDALRQALEAFHNAQPVFTGKKVLLAQMLPDQAAELAFHIRCTGQPDCPYGFDLVISRADEEHATLPGIRTVETSIAGANATLPVTPRPVYHTKGYGEIMPCASAPAGTAGDVEGIITPVSSVIITREVQVGGRQTTGYGLATNWCLFPLAQPTVSAVLEQLENAAAAKLTQLQHANPPYQPQGISNVQRLALAQMLDFTKADIALLQKRDFFQASEKADPPPDEMLERVLWKGDLVTTVVLSGDQLKSVLKRSAAYDKADNSVIAEPATANMGLVVLGILPKNGWDSDKAKLYVDADLIDTKRLYLVATSTFMASGDTGYPEFAQPAVGKFSGMARRGGQKVSALVCAALPLCGQPAGVVSASEFQSDPFTSAPDNRRNENYPLRVKKSFTDWNGPNPFKSTGQENAFQQGWINHLALQELSGAFSFNSPNLTDTDLQNKFTAVAYSGVSDAHSNDFEIKMQSRYMLESPGFAFGPFGRIYGKETLNGIDWGTETFFDWERKRQGVPGKPDSVNVPKNMGSVSFPVIQLHLHRYMPRWKMMVLQPAYFSTQISEGVLNVLSFDKQQLDNPPVLHRRQSWAPRAGTRYEKDAQNYLEAGVQLSQDFEVLSKVIVNPGEAGAFTCGLIASQSFQDCITSKAHQPLIRHDSAIERHYSTFHQSGLYWDTKFALPLPLSLTFKVDSKGDYFFYPDSGAETLTRYDATVGFGIKLPVWGNLGLEPRYEFFFYQNKLQLNTLTRDSLTFKLTYNLDRYGRRFRRGLRWRDAVQYKTPSQ